MTTHREQDIFKMAVAGTRAMVSESFDSFVAPVIKKSVPNHLLETSKCNQILFKYIIEGFYLP